MAYMIEKDLCMGCGACAYVCLFNTISICEDDNEKYVINPNKCFQCGQCVKMCPNSAIHLAPDSKKIKILRINPEECDGDGLCRSICKVNAPFKKEDGTFEIDQNKCFQCGLCAKSCKKKIIKVEY